MKKKIVGILICTLLIISGSGTVFGSAMNVKLNVNHKENTDGYELLLRDTITVYSTNSDGYIFQGHPGYNNVWTASSGSVSDDGIIAYIGQSYYSNMYMIFRSFLFFDTSDIPDDANLISVTLSIYVYSKTAESGDYDIIIQNGQPTYPHNPLESGDFYKGHYSDNGGSINTNGIQVHKYNDIEFDTEDLDWIQKSGTTKLCLRSSDDINGNTPVGEDYIQWYPSEYIYDPKLTIEYTIQTNNPPSTPQIIGPTEGEPGKSYSFKFKSTDSDGDNVYYWVDWGDGTNTGWKGPYAQNIWQEFSHTWDNQGTYDITAKAKDTNAAESDWSDPYTINIIPMPDLIAYDISVYPSVFDPGELVEIKGAFRNIGTGDVTDDFVVRLVYFGYYSDKTIPGLHVGENKVFNININWPDDTEWHDIDLYVDYYNDINDESNEENNHREESFICSLPDLIVLDVWTVPENFGPGANLNICTTIMNQGTKTAELEDPQQGFITSFRFDGEGEFIGNFLTQSLEPGETKTDCIPFIWPEDRRSHEVKVIVDLGTPQNPNPIIESNENNNERTMHKSAPRNKAINTPFLNYLQDFLTGHPNLFPILRQLLGL